MAVGIYTAPVPAAYFELRNLIAASVANGMPMPDAVVLHTTQGLVFGYSTDPNLTGPQVTNWRALIASNPVPSGTPWEVLSSLQDKAAAALTANSTYLAIVSPTNAQVVAQVAALTRQVDAVIRMLTNALSSSADT